MCLFILLMASVCPCRLGVRRDGVVRPVVLPGGRVHRRVGARAAADAAAGAAPRARRQAQRGGQAQRQAARLADNTVPTSLIHRLLTGSYIINTLLVAY